MFWFFGHEAFGILAPQPGIEPAPPVVEEEGEVLTTGLSGKSQASSYLNFVKQQRSPVKSQSIYPVYNQAAFSSLASVWFTPRTACPDLQKENPGIRDEEGEVGVKKVRTGRPEAGHRN